MIDMPRDQPLLHRLDPKYYIRIIANVEIDRETGCWNSTYAPNSQKLSPSHRREGRKSPQDYTRITVSFNGREYKRLVHRIMWCWANGREAPEGLDIGHKCDNPRCCNPLHLEAITRSQNTRDARDRMHNLCGQKLTPAQVRLIKWLLKNTSLKQREIGDHFGVDLTTVCNINTGYTWPDLEIPASWPQIKEEHRALI